MKWHVNFGFIVKGELEEDEDEDEEETEQKLSSRNNLSQL